MPPGRRAWTWPRKPPPPPPAQEKSGFPSCRPLQHKALCADWKRRSHAETSPSRRRRFLEKNMVVPCTIDISDERLATIGAKVAACDWSQLPDAEGWTSGVGVDDLKRLVAYWREAYDWRRIERRLDQLPNFATDVEGSEYTSFMCWATAPSRRCCFCMVGRARFLNLDSSVCSIRSRRMGTTSLFPRFRALPSPGPSLVSSARVEPPGSCTR